MNQGKHGNDQSEARRALANQRSEPDDTGSDDDRMVIVEMHDDSSEFSTCQRADRRFDPGGFRPKAEGMFDREK